MWYCLFRIWKCLPKAWKYWWRPAQDSQGQPDQPWRFIDSDQQQTCQQRGEETVIDRNHFLDNGEKQIWKTLVKLFVLNSSFLTLVLRHILRTAAAPSRAPAQIVCVCIIAGSFKEPRGGSLPPVLPPRQGSPQEAPTRPHPTNHQVFLITGGRSVSKRGAGARSPPWKGRQCRQQGPLFKCVCISRRNFKICVAVQKRRRYWMPPHQTKTQDTKVRNYV